MEKSALVYIVLMLKNTRGTDIQVVIFGNIENYHYLYTVI